MLHKLFHSKIFFHIGGVKIGNDVFIGSYSNVDRGHIDNTTIGYNSDGQKIYGKWPQGTKKQMVKVKKLDEHNFEKIDFIKIDVQSYEYEVLKGAKKTLEINSPIICLEEIDPKNSKAIKFLESLNYVIIDVVVKEYIFKNYYLGGIICIPYIVISSNPWNP